MYQYVRLVTGLSVWQNHPVFHIGDVVRKLRTQRGLDLKDVAERAGMSMTTLSEFERGKGNQSRRTIERIAAAIDESVPALYARLNVLMTAGAEPPVDGNATRLDEDVANYKREDIPVIQEGEASPSGLSWDAETRSTKELEHTSRPYDFRETGAYAIVLHGDSMEPLLKRGMRLIVSVTKPVSDGDLVYAQLKSGERLIKIATRVPGGWLLTSANPAHGPRQVANDEVEHIHKVAYVRFLK